MKELFLSTKNKTSVRFLVEIKLLMQYTEIKGAAMKILVCVKQVAGAESRFQIADDHKAVCYNEDTVYRMNRFDEFALEEALLIRETHKGCVDAISVGPERVINTIRRAMELGTDKCIHILLNEEGYVSPGVISNLIACFAAEGLYDLILTGAMAEDDLYGQTGQMIAGILNYPCASSVILERLNKEENTVYVEREIDAVTREAVTLRLPAVLTIQSGINRPRYPSLSNVLRARSQKIITIKPDKSSFNCGHENVKNIRSVVPSRKCIILNGAVEQKAIALWEILQERSLIK
jgi:electron transfer flavoprotein beta subunit